MGCASIVVAWPAELVDTTGVIVVPEPSPRIETHGVGAPVVVEVAVEDSSRTTFGTATTCDTSKRSGISDDTGVIMVGQISVGGRISQRQRDSAERERRGQTSSYTTFETFKKGTCVVPELFTQCKRIPGTR